MDRMIGASANGLVILGILVAVYVFPTIVAFHRKVGSPWSVAVINVLLGWTFVGWVVAMAMAARSVPPTQAEPMRRLDG